MIYKYLILIINIEFILYLYTYKTIIRQDQFIKTNNKKGNKSKISLQDITLVTAYYNITSKHSFNEYLNWMNNFLKINSSLVFYGEKLIINISKELRPKKYHNKTLWIERDMKDFYSFKNYYKEFNETFQNDCEKQRHNTLLYLIWAEKIYFLKEVVDNNVFNTKCFYWIDIGYFRNPINSEFNLDFPSSKNCLEDPRVIFNSLRKFYNKEIIAFKRLDIKFYKKFIKNCNVGAGMFGGQKEYIDKFYTLYFNTIKIFIEKNFFIGKEQNIFAYIALVHPNVVKLIYSKDWFYFRKYLSPYFLKDYKIIEKSNIV